MAPKRRAVSAAKAGGKKARQTLLSAGPQVKRKRKVDEGYALSLSGEVYEDYDCMLNQTNVERNNNKFYAIQVFKANKKYYSWNRWGRVGQVGQSKLNPFNEPEEAVKDFEKKFKDKTKNNWSDRENFVSHPGKYTLIEVEVTEDVLPCTLDAATKDLISLIFISDMYRETMDCMNVDIKKMPLGKLSKLQIAKGFDVLEEIEAAMKPKSRNKNLEELSSKFFTTIPHNVGRNRLLIIDNSKIVEEKKEMLMVLADIELAQTLKSETEIAQAQGEFKAQVEAQVEAQAQAQDEIILTVPHPLDQYYNSLKCRLTLMNKDTEIFKIIERYLNATSGGNFQLKIINVWEVDREKEGDRFSKNDRLENRRLLWHGTKIAVVAAILKSGLRIMPHSGGRVGRGIYFASESSLSAEYAKPEETAKEIIPPEKNTGVMFLGEVALGNESTITRDNTTLRRAPAGCHSVVARGKVEPDPSRDISITLEGKEVVVPQGEPIKQPDFSNSDFDNSEYLIYKESQCRLRYLLKLKILRKPNKKK